MPYELYILNRLVSLFLYEIIIIGKTICFLLCVRRGGMLL